MRFLILGDIHANLPALEAVLKDAKTVGFDRIICTGDVVGYYPWPNEVVNWVRENVDVCVLGNHDAIVAGLLSPDTFSSHAREAIEWTDRIISSRNREFLKSLPLKVDFLEKTCAVHDTPVYPLSMIYITDPYGAAEVFRKTDYEKVFYGHTHIPAIFLTDGVQIFGTKPGEFFPLREGWRYLINPGSVGQPRDGVPKASYMVWDDEENVIYHRRIEFDIGAVIAAVERTGLPPELGYRLLRGL
jgi:predicted phosphodiesterase